MTLCPGHSVVLGNPSPGHLSGKKNVIQKDTCNPVFIAAKTRKQPRCPSTEEWIKKMWWVYAMECYSAMKQ